MPLNGSGGVTQPTGSIYPATANTLIESAKFNTLIADIYTILASALYKDGQQTATARVPFAAGISVDDIDEKTSNNGVDVDGVLLKDSTAEVTEIRDTSGNEAIKVTATASAVNEFTVANAATGSGPTLSATGGDTNIDINLTPKGTGDVKANGDLVVSGATMVQNSQSDAYTLVAADANKHILHPAADNNPRTFTIPANASVAFAIGTAVTFVNKVNTVTIAITSDTLTFAGDGSTGSRTLAANGIATVLKIASTEWIITGTGLT